MDLNSTERPSHVSSAEHRPRLHWMEDLGASAPSGEAFDLSFVVVVEVDFDYYDSDF